MLNINVINKYTMNLGIGGLFSISQRWAKRNQKRKAQLPQPPQLWKLRCALIFYFETLRSCVAD